MKFRLAASTCLLLLVLAVSASASPVGLVGTGSSGTLQVTLLSLTWTSDPAALPLPGPPWNEDVNTSSHLTFAGCATGVNGSPGCLFTQEGVLINNGNPFCGGTNSTCPGGAEALPQPKFLQFEGHPNLIYQLNTVAAGSSTNCLVNAAVTCSIFLGGVGSPIVLTPIGNFGTSASIGLMGVASDAGIAGLTQPGSNSTWTGGFNATIPDMTPQQIVDFFCPGGACNVNAVLTVNSVGGSFAATAIPEPGTVSMIVIGVALVTLSQVRKRTRKA